MVQAKRSIRIFLSSPGDVREEREIAVRVASELGRSSAFRNTASLDILRWEDAQIDAAHSIQEAITSPAAYDIFVMILWNRWGTRLPIKGPDGREYLSGTHYEFETALEQAKATGRPKILVYRRITDSITQVDISKGNPIDFIEQKNLVSDFFESFRTEDGLLRAAYHSFQTPDDFGHLFRNHLNRLALDELMESGPPVERLVRGEALSSALPPGNKTGGLFLSYRREDSQWAAGRMADRFRSELGEDLVFLDVDAIPLGANFSEEIERWLSECDFLLAIVGPGWLSAKSKAGNRRIDNPTDLVRLEIEKALRLGVPVIPVFLDETKAIEAEDLPHSIAELTSRQAFWVRCKYFRSDMEDLVSRLRKVLNKNHEG